ncbi:aminotransferase class I/II-fold pyridoxal phosphate-dependent enzyme [Stappia sp. GBMRC 2046]|uniref:Aminotransferase class I/II-fold pyridoxal phosphate-dependent enzyme n=1 Tax=Stappia sediminis TaxID=2692190 RepID=A0A7X3LRI1_9HYPH|nr:PLP-dependent aminotransferase family protein [Stappia sediminis]MXN63759.1 aminotransferase class I/II-fold pyridoxal phosphate-dependent enzyme [Stappia sediminis]
MTNWLPDISKGDGPLYVRLADRIESDIHSGLLPTGTKLPPQRDLAYDIGVTIGTVGRAYALARERGLVSGEVGRGTYIQSRNTPMPGNNEIVEGKGLATSIEFAGTRAILPEPGTIMMDSSAAPDIGQSAALERILMDISRSHPHEIASYSRTHPRNWLEAGSRWAACGGWLPAPETIVPTVGAHAGIVAVLSAMTAPGDLIVFENLTYSSFARTVPLLGRRVIIVESDDEGVLSEDFERLCAQWHPKVLFLMPAMRNPTLGILPDARRREIVEIARRYNVWLIEDGVYGAMIENQSTPIAAMAPERTFHVTSLSKAIAAGVRGGYVACPPAYVQRILTAHKMAAGGMIFLLAELAARLVLSGAADQIREKVKDVVAEREALAREMFAGFDFRSHPRVPFLWMKLPEPWLSGTFKKAVLQNNVLIDDEDEFKPARTDKVYHRVRFGFTAPKSLDDARAGFEVIRRLLAEPTASYDDYS